MNSEPHPPAGQHRPSTALLLTGGGARAASQVGVLRSISRVYPHLHFPILTGVSAGAINTALLASFPEAFPEAVTRLANGPGDSGPRYPTTGIACCACTGSDSAALPSAVMNSRRLTRRD